MDQHRAGLATSSFPSIEPEPQTSFRHGAPKEIALDCVTAELLEGVPGGFIFDAFGHNRQSKAVCKVDDRANNCP